MIRHQPKRRGSERQPQNPLTYRDFRTGRFTFSKSIQGNLIQSEGNIAQCVPANFALTKGITAEMVEKFPFLQGSASQFSAPGTTFAHWHENSQRFFHNLVTKVKCSDRTNPPAVANELESMREHALRNNVKVIAMSRSAKSPDG